VPLDDGRQNLGPLLKNHDRIAMAEFGNNLAELVDSALGTIQVRKVHRDIVQFPGSRSTANTMLRSTRLLSSSVNSIRARRIEIVIGRFSLFFVTIESAIASPHQADLESCRSCRWRPPFDRIGGPDRAAPSIIGQSRPRRPTLRPTVA